MLLRQVSNDLLVRLAECPGAFEIHWPHAFVAVFDAAPSHLLIVALRVTRFVRFRDRAENEAKRWVFLTRHWVFSTTVTDGLRDEAAAAAARRNATLMITIFFAMGLFRSLLQATTTITLDAIAMLTLLKITIAMLFSTLLNALSLLQATTTITLIIAILTLTLLTITIAIMSM